MNGAMSNGRWAMRKIRIPFWLFSLLIAHCAFGVVVFAADPTPRLFFSDANISFRFPNHWELQGRFPYGPMFTKTTHLGGTSTISCAISAPLSNDHLMSDLSESVLKQLAKQELATSQPDYKLVSERDRRLANRNAYEIVWENTVSSQTMRHQTIYFYVQNRVYALTLRSLPRTFKWSAPDFENWLTSLRILSRKDAGALSEPAQGGLWIHQTGGAKIKVSDPWIIAVSDDRTLGVTYARGEFHADFTATVEVGLPPAQTFSSRDRKDIAKAVRQKGLRLLQESEEPFHGFPAYQVRYEGMLKDRLVKGADLWVLTPKGRWLFNFEGDVSLYNSLAEPYTEILKNIEFL
jgi:hypothetical protein